MDANQYFHIGNPGRPITIPGLSQASRKASKGPTPSQGSAPIQRSQQFSGDQVMDALATFTGIRFDSVGDFLGYYQGNYFQTAYTQLKPFTCHQLAIGNPYITAAIDAIADPISTT